MTDAVRRCLVDMQKKDRHVPREETDPRQISEHLAPVAPPTLAELVAAHKSRGINRPTS